MNQVTYLDYNATSPLSPKVEKYLKEEMFLDYMNPSSEHDGGFLLNGKIKFIRAEIADFLNVSSKSIIFTSGGTESIATVLSFKNINSNNIKTIITSKMEHHVTLKNVENLSKEGIRVLYVKNNRNGELDYIHLEELLSNNSNCLISLLYVNNETGVINNVLEISRLAKKYNSLFHLDAVQALGKIHIDLYEIGCDFASFSGHKIGSLKGVGILYVNDLKSFSPLIQGGSQERGFRAGTVNFPAIKSLSLALQDINLSNLNTLIRYRSDVEVIIKSISDNISINCEDAERVWNTISINLGNRDAREVLLKLSRKNIFVSTGSACNGSSQVLSHVIEEIKPSGIINTLRVSFKDEIDEKFFEEFKRFYFDI